MGIPVGFDAIDSLEKLSEHFPSIRRIRPKARGIGSDEVEETVKRIVNLLPGSKDKIFIIKSPDRANRDATAYSILKMLLERDKRILVPVTNGSEEAIEGHPGKDDVLFLKTAGSRSNNEVTLMEQGRLLGDIWSGRTDPYLQSIPVIAVTDSEVTQSGEGRPTRQNSEGRPNSQKMRVWKGTFSAGFLFLAAGFLLTGIENGIKAYLGLTGVGYATSYSSILMNLLVYGEIPTSAYNYFIVFPFLLIFGTILILISRKFVDRRTYRIFIYASIFWVVGVVGTAFSIDVVFFYLLGGVNQAWYLFSQSSLQATFLSLAFAFFIVRFASRKFRGAIIILSAGYVAVSVFQTAVTYIFGMGRMIQLGDRIVPSNPMLISYSLYAIIYAMYFALFLKIALYPRVINDKPGVVDPGTSSTIFQ